MGRGVEYIGDNVVYFDAVNFQEDYEWGNLIDQLQDDLVTQYPSMCRTDRFAAFYDESRIIVENNLVSMSISEYCGCGAVSVFVCQELDYRIPEALAEHWLDQCWSGIKKRIENHFSAVLNKIGTMSNGVSAYKKKAV